MNVYILGVEWKLEFCDTLSDFGECQVDERLIKIRRLELETAREQQIMAETLIHEILHAIFAMMDIDLKATDEESTVTRLAMGLASVLADPKNDRILGYL